MRIDAATELYCVFGDPVAHSQSPVMHNAAFEATGINGVYVAVAVKDIGAAMAAVRTLGIRGVSVTIPHKSAVMDCLDEVDETARAIGAVNTVVNREGRLLGGNTDWQGAVRALNQATTISGKRVLILGAGGAARAVAYGIQCGGGRLLIANRTLDRAERLAASFGGEVVDPAVPIEKTAEHDIDILINTTSIGMTPNREAMPVPETFLRPSMTVMDIVYNPLETRLLKAARTRGCRTVDGLSMFVHQGICQFERWTGTTAPAAAMRQSVLTALAGQTHHSPFNT